MGNRLLISTLLLLLCLSGILTGNISFILQYKISSQPTKVTVFLRNRTSLKKMTALSKMKPSGAILPMESSPAPSKKKKKEERAERRKILKKSKKAPLKKNKSSKVSEKSKSKQGTGKSDKASSSDSGLGTSATNGESPATYDSVSNPQPKYPLTSRKLKEEGEVTLLIDVAASGDVMNIQIIKSSGFSRLDKSALYSVSRWNFKPAIGALGKPKDSQVKVSFSFTANQF